MTKTNKKEQHTPMANTPEQNRPPMQRPLNVTTYTQQPYSSHLEHLELSVPATVDRELKIGAAFHQAAHVTIATRTGLTYRESHDCTIPYVVLCNGPSFLLCDFEPEDFMRFAMTAWAGVIAERLGTGRTVDPDHESDLDFVFHGGVDHEAADVLAGRARAVDWEHDARSGALDLVRTDWRDIADLAWTYLLTVDDDEGEHPEARPLQRR